MEFIYSVQLRGNYSEETDEYFYDEKEIHFETSDEEIIDALADILVMQSQKSELTAGDYKVCKNIVKKIIKEQDMQEILAEEYKEELKELFRDEALSL